MYITKLDVFIFTKGRRYIIVMEMEFIVPVIINLTVIMSKLFSVC